jgi:hypothetical protein
VIRTYPGSRICEAGRVGTTFICTRKEKGLTKLFMSIKKNHRTFTTRLLDVHTRDGDTCGCAVDLPHVRLCGAASLHLPSGPP